MPGAPFSTMGLSPMDEHVLERISAMEYALSTIAQRIDTLSETVERGEVNRLIDRTMIEMLAESLESADIDLSNLESDWQKRIDSLLAGDEDGAHAEHEEPAERKDRDKRSERNERNKRNRRNKHNKQDVEADRLGQRVEQIVSAYRGDHRKQFTTWMERAHKLLASEHPTESLSSLESAFAEDPSNRDLGMLLAEVFFQAKKFESAKRCLSQVLQSQPDRFEARLPMERLEKTPGNPKQGQSHSEDRAGGKRRLTAFRDPKRSG